MSTSLSATDAARRFSDLLNRVRYRGETFVIVRNGEEVAQLTVVPNRPLLPLAEVFQQLALVRSGDPGFADDLEAVQADQAPAGDAPWTS